MFRKSSVSFFLRKNLPICQAAAASANPKKRSRPGNVPIAQSAEVLRGGVFPIAYSTLPNGFRVACEHVPNLEFVTIGVWIDAGSRFETRENNGTAHFLEHLNFKGTKKFSRQYIETLFEHLGAHFNAYTSRDRTAYYIKVFNKDVDRVMDLLADILRCGVYKTSDLEYERSTILSEMREVEEIVDEVIMDNLHLTAFDQSVSGLPLTILGPAENISKNIDRKMIMDFVATHYTGPRMSLVSSGGLTQTQLEGIAKRCFGDLPGHSNRPKLESKYVGGISTMWNTTMRTTHVCFAYPVCGASDTDSIPLQLMQNVFGMYRREQHDLFSGQGGLNTHARENAPEMEMIQPFYTPYEEVSLLGFYFVSMPMSFEKQQNDSMTNVLHSCIHNLYELSHKPMSEDLLNKAKASYKATQLLACDSTTNSAEEIGRQMLHFGRRVPVEEIFEKVDQVTPESLSKTLHKYIANLRPTVSVIGHPNTLPNYDELILLNDKTASS